MEKKKALQLTGQILRLIPVNFMATSSKLRWDFQEVKHVHYLHSIFITPISPLKVIPTEDTAPYFIKGVFCEKSGWTDIGAQSESWEPTGMGLSQVLVLTCATWVTLMFTKFTLVLSVLLKMGMITCQTHTVTLSAINKNLALKKVCCVFPKKLRTKRALQWARLSDGLCWSC